MKRYSINTNSRDRQLIENPDGDFVDHTDYIKMQDLFLKILHCFGEMEGTWFERSWESYGISKEDAEKINKLYKERYENPKKI
jgi:hypothetical protein